MSGPHVSETEPASASPDATEPALFAHLVMQQANMALMLLGKTAHPETGKTIRDIEAAKLFIDLLEMLESKTKGNLSKEESALLKQTLMTLRLSFVEAVESEPSQPEAQAAQTAAAPESSQRAEPAKPAPAPGSADSGEEEEHRTKFSKKY